MKVGVIGAGVMGGGIAQCFASAPGYSVVLCDLTEENAAAGKEKLAQDLEKRIKRDKMTREEADAILSRIGTGTKEAVADCDLVVEAAVERMDLKKALFGELERICKKEALFATNTSSLSITELCAGPWRPIVGMHFFNPAPYMKLVEVVVGLSTPRELAERAKQIAADIGKTPVECKDEAGFIVNRTLIPMINEAIAVLAERVATAEDIDAAMRLGANHPIGPLALGDMIGLDVCLAIMEDLREQTGDPKYRPHPRLRKMVSAGLLGRKTGKGFYNY